MNQPVRALPWLFATAALAAVAWALVAGPLPEPAWQVTVVASGLTAAVTAWAVHRLPLLISAAAVIAAVHLVGSDLDESSRTDGLSAGHALTDLLVGLTLCGVLALVLYRRHGMLRTRDAIDVLAVVLGLSLVGWIVVANPLIHDYGTPPGVALIATAYLPTSALLVTFTVDLMFSGLTSNRSLRFVVLAAVFNLVATLVTVLRYVEVASVDGRPVAGATYVASFLLMCAAITHADAPGALERLTDDPVARSESPARLWIMSLSVLAPFVSMAAVSPTSAVDLGVRTAGTVALVVTVAVRLAIAMRGHADARQALVRRLSRDDLTGLPTRSLFVEIVSEILEKTWRSERHPTVVQLNLDRFKNINDSLGHYDANEVLVAVGHRLEDAASRFGGTVARAGGDDFAVVDGSTCSQDEATERAETLREALATPIAIGDHNVFVTASIGVAVAPRNRTITADELMRRADIATHRAKADGRNRIAVFDDSMQARLTHRMDVEQALHGAIGRQEMRLYHQPIVDIVTGRISGFEALIRWQRPDGTLVSPGDFIPIAEETGIICELGEWALQEALTELRGWIDDGMVPPTATTSVNVSPRQIADPTFADVVRDVLDRTGVSPHLLWLEMTESMMLEEPELAERTLRKIRSMGVRLALDDFGTGYSSLSLLQQFPIQRIKIDRAFVQGLSDRGNDRSLVRTIIAMAQSMGLDLVAEGVETVHQLQGLRELGCSKAQGYLISHPVPADAMRSTMVALDELASLSLFGDVDDDAPVVLPRHEPAVPSVAGPLGGLGRPLGQPLL